MVLVSDCYAAYHHYDGPKHDGLKQRCWAHLLRDIHDQRTLYPKDAALARWAAAVHQLYVEAKAFSHTQPRRRRTVQLALERRLMASSRPFLADPSAVQGRLCRPSSVSSRAGPVLDTGNSSSSRPKTGRASGQQRRRAQPAPSGHQPQGQRRHPLGAGHREQDDVGIPLRHLARPRSKSSRRLPSVARFPSTLNCYVHEHPHNLWRRAVALRHIQRGQA